MNNIFEEYQQQLMDMHKEAQDRAQSAAYHQDQLVQEKLTLDEIRENHNDRT